MKAKIVHLVAGLPLKKDLAFILRGGKGVEEYGRGGIGRLAGLDVVKA